MSTSAAGNHDALPSKPTTTTTAAAASTTLPPATAASTTTPPSTVSNNDRRTSFNFLRRQKSTEGPPGAARNKMHKIGRKGSSGAPVPQNPNIPRVPPQLPQLDQSSFNDAQGQYFGHSSPAHFQNQQQYGGASPQGQGYGAPYSPQQYASAQHHQSMSPGQPGKNGEYEPFARTESMTHRGRYSYASSAISATGINSPRRVRRRKDPTPFNILVIGEHNSGKSSFIDFLRYALAPPSSKQQSPSPPRSAMDAESPFTPHYLETEVDHERIGVTLWDSQGLEKKFVDLQLREMSSFLESKFEETFTEEQKVVRAPGVRDTHIHCVFLILDPVRLDANLAYARKLRPGPASKFDEALRLMGVLDEDLDVQVLRTLQGKTTVIPVISKADTISTAHMALLKKAVWESLKQAKLDPLEALNFVDSESEEDPERLDERDEDEYRLSPDRDVTDDIIDDLLDRTEDDAPPSPPKEAKDKDAHRRSMSDTLNAPHAADETPYLPLSIISPDNYDPGVIGRRFPWGFADPYNPEHCDFIRLKESVFSEWRSELREASREVWYEGWRTSRLKRRAPKGVGNGNGVGGAGGQQMSPGRGGRRGDGRGEMVGGVWRQGVNAF
ncbi:hypothetical protein EJ06DRAFT_145744 [Trichodelitschia bisporula]|uniref:Septin-type G domain-containing protein n=1 Tax=Trichodelitschia bisporula TaxID=703511 RepID=A0A6G1HNM1_9PEZI|nr:hypothetical protein EJ06DRAFT_145744 [Trichodelitschia bisporula]